MWEKIWKRMVRWYYRLSYGYKKEVYSDGKIEIKWHFSDVFLGETGKIRESNR